MKDKPRPQLLFWGFWQPRELFFPIESQKEAATRLKFSQRRSGNKVSKAEAIAVVFDGARPLRILFVSSAFYSSAVVDVVPRLARQRVYK